MFFDKRFTFKNLMGDTVIKVKNLSKQYCLVNIGTGSLAHEMNRTCYRVRGKEGPYLKSGKKMIEVRKAVVNMR